MKVRSTEVRALHETEAVMLRLDLVTTVESVSGRRSRSVDLHVNMSTQDARTLAVQLQEAADHLEREQPDHALATRQIRVS